MWPWLWSYFAVVNQIWTKLVHTFDLQTPITAECSMHRCKATAVAMASWGTCREHDGMRPPTFHPNQSIDRRVIAFPIFCNIAVVRHLEYEFCYSGQPTKSTMRLAYPVKIWCRSDISRRFFATLAGKMPNHAFFKVFWGLNPLKLWVVIQTPKRHILGWWRVI